jgi:hypothetical protein
MFYIYISEREHQAMIFIGVDLIAVRVLNLG